MRGKIKDFDEVQKDLQLKELQQHLDLTKRKLFNYQRLFGGDLCRKLNQKA